jgi:hypothetical protein
MMTHIQQLLVLIRGFCGKYSTCASVWKRTWKLVAYIPIACLPMADW